MREGWILQLHTSQGAESGFGEGVGGCYEEAFEAEGTGRSESDEESESGADEEEVLEGRVENLAG